MFVVVLEQEGEIDAMTSLALERSIPKDTFLTASDNQDRMRLWLSLLQGGRSRGHL